MQVLLNDIVKSNYCYYDLYSECVTGLEMPDTKVCGKCAAHKYEQIVREPSL